MKFWERVESAISAQNTTFRWIAEKIVHKSETTVSGWRRLDVLPRADDAVKIANALGTTVEYLVSGKDPAGAVPFKLARLCPEIEKLSDKDLNAIETIIKTMVGQTTRGQRASSEGVG